MAALMQYDDQRAAAEPFRLGQLCVAASPCTPDSSSVKGTHIFAGDSHIQASILSHFLISGKHPSLLSIALILTLWPGAAGVAAAAARAAALAYHQLAFCLGYYWD